MRTHLPATTSRPAWLHLSNFTRHALARGILRISSEAKRVCHRDAQLCATCIVVLYSPWAQGLSLANGGRPGDKRRPGRRERYLPSTLPLSRYLAGLHVGEYLWALTNTVTSPAVDLLSDANLDKIRSVWLRPAGFQRPGEAAGPTPLPPPGAALNVGSWAWTAGNGAPLSGARVRKPSPTYLHM